MAISTITATSTTGVIQAGTARSAYSTFNATFNGTTTMTVTSVSAGAMVVGQIVGISPYPTITAQLTGVAGSTGTYTLSTTVNAGSYQLGTYGYDFLNVPSWARRITIVYDSVSNSGSSHVAQLGTAGGIVTTNYISAVIQNSPSNISYGGSTSSFMLTIPYSATSRYNGSVVFTLLGSNTWVQQSVLGDGYGAYVISTSTGRVTLASQLTQIRVLPATAVGGAIFDNGSFNILYE